MRVWGRIAAVSVVALVLVPDARAQGAGDVAFMVAGTGLEAPWPQAPRGGGLATRARIGTISGLAALPDGGFLAADGFFNCVWRVWPDGRITVVASPSTGIVGWDVAALPDGGFLTTSFVSVVRVYPDGTAAAVAGSADRSSGYSGDGGPATHARLGRVLGVAALPDGGFLIADGPNHRVRRVSADGTITTVAGSGEEGFSGDGGPATAARLGWPMGLAVRPDGSFLIADPDSHRVRQVTPDGTISTVAGGGAGGDGEPATQAALKSPRRLALAVDGGFLVADTDDARVRHVAVDGTITTVAGTGDDGFPPGWTGVPFPSGEGGPATQVRIAPDAVAVRPDGGLLIGAVARVLLAAPRQTSLLALALRPDAGRITNRGVEVDVAATVPAQLSVAVGRDRRTVARHSAHASAGTTRVRIPAIGGTGPYRIAITARSADGQRAAREIGMYFGARLNSRSARPLAASYWAWVVDPTGQRRAAPGACQRFSARRVDCLITRVDRNGQSTGCSMVLAMTLHRTAHVTGPPYACAGTAKERFRRDPSFSAPPTRIPVAGIADATPEQPTSRPTGTAVNPAGHVAQSKARA